MARRNAVIVMAASAVLVVAVLVFALNPSLRASAAEDAPPETVTLSDVDLTPAPPTEHRAAAVRVPAPNAVADKPTRTEVATESNAAPDRAGQATVTITGCLEATPDGSQFRLTDTDGDDAPKARGWRSGFIRKRSAPVNLVGVPDRARSRTYVGHRVVATGLLASRELRVRSLAPAGALLCD